MSSITLIGEDGDDTIKITLSTVTFYGAGKLAYWGWMATSSMLTEAQIIVLQGSGFFDHDATITADFRLGNDTPKYLYLAEREAEAEKTAWYGSGIDYGEIGGAGMFTNIGTINGWRVYRSSVATQFSTTTEFRVS